MLSRFITIVIGIAASSGHHDTGRLEHVANNMWDAAGARPAYCSDASTDAGQYATALALLGIAHHESRLHPLVQVCRYGQADPAVSLFALNGPVALQGHSKREVCSNNALAASLAALALSRFKGCGTQLAAAQGYASGDTTVKSTAAKEIADQIANLHWRERIIVTYKDGCLHASYRKD